MSLFACIWLMLVLSSDVKSQPVPPINLPIWMTEFQFLFDQPISKSIFPGSHDSGSYRLSTDIGTLNTGDPVINELLELADKLKLPVWEVLMPWSITQANQSITPDSHMDNQSINQSINQSTRKEAASRSVNQTTHYSSLSDQAMLGMRYFDLRLAYVEDQSMNHNNQSINQPLSPSISQSSGTWRIQHGLLGVDIRTCLTDLSRFLSSKPGEFLIIEMGHVEFVNQSSYRSLGQSIDQSINQSINQSVEQSTDPAYDQLLKVIQSIFGPLLVPCDQIFSQTVNQLVQSNQRALIVVDPQILGQSINQPVNICDASQLMYNTYADTPDVSKMQDYNTGIINQFNKQLINQSINQLSIKSDNRHRKHLLSMSTKHQETTKSINQSTNQPINQSIIRSINQSISQSNKPLWKVSYILTPDAGTILESVIPGFPHSLIDLATKANSQLDSYIQSINQQGLQAGNIFLVDDAANSVVVQSVIANAFMMHDKAKHNN